MNRLLHGLKALVTSGPTQEPLDPVRYLSNHSSGKQGHAIAASLAAHGAAVTLISGPVQLPNPEGVKVIHVTQALEMLQACLGVLEEHIDIAVCAAAVSDWRFEAPSPQKIKKQADVDSMAVTLVKNPDILHTVATHPSLRPRLVIGFAAETDQLITHARAKHARKSCDWLLANDVSQGVFNADNNTVYFIHHAGEETWPTMEKTAVADYLINKIKLFFI